MSELLGRRRNAIRDYILANIEVKDVWDEIRESLVDKVEAVHFTGALHAGDSAGQRFILSTLGKDRGYSTRQELTGSDGAPFAFEVTLKPGPAPRPVEKEIQSRVIEIEVNK